MPRTIIGIWLDVVRVVEAEHRIARRALAYGVVAELDAGKPLGLIADDAPPWGTLALTTTTRDCLPIPWDRDGSTGHKVSF